MSFLQEAVMDISGINVSTRVFYPKPSFLLPLSRNEAGAACPVIPRVAWRPGGMLSDRDQKVMLRALSCSGSFSPSKVPGKYAHPAPGKLISLPEGRL